MFACCTHPRTTRPAHFPPSLSRLPLLLSYQHFMTSSRPRRPRHTRASAAAAATAAATHQQPSRSCSVCLTSNSHKVLVCSACDKAFHGYCLNPPNPQTPDSTWSCPTCTNSSRRALKSSALTSSNSHPNTRSTTRLARRSANQTNTDTAATTTTTDIDTKQRINASTSSTAASSDRAVTMTRSRAKSAASVNTETDTDDDDDDEEEEDDEEDDDVKDPDFTHADTSPVVTTRASSRRARKSANSNISSTSAPATTTATRSPISTRGRKRRAERECGDTTAAPATTTRSPASKGATTTASTPNPGSPQPTIKKRKYMRRKFSNNNSNVSGDSLSDTPSVVAATAPAAVVTPIPTPSPTPTPIPPVPMVSSNTTRIGVSPRKGRPPSRPRPQTAPKPTQALPPIHGTKIEAQQASMPASAPVNMSSSQPTQSPPQLPQQQTQHTGNGVTKPTRPHLLADKEQALFTLARASTNARVGAATFGRNEQMRATTPVQRHQSTASHQSSIGNSLAITRADAQRPMTSSYSTEHARVQAHAHASSSLPATYRIPPRQPQPQHQQSQQYYEQRRVNGAPAVAPIQNTAYQPSYAQLHQQTAAAAVRQHDQSAQRQGEQQQVYAPTGGVRYRIGGAVGVRTGSVPSEVSLSSSGGARPIGTVPHQHQNVIRQSQPVPPPPQPGNTTLPTPLSYAHSTAPKVTPIPPPQYAQPATQRATHYPSPQYLPQRNGVQQYTTRYAQPQTQLPQKQAAAIPQMQSYQHPQLQNRGNAFVRQASTQGSSTFNAPPPPPQPVQPVQPSHYQQYPARHSTAQRTALPQPSYLATSIGATYLAPAAPAAPAAAPAVASRGSYQHPTQQPQQPQPPPPPQRQLYATPPVAAPPNAYHTRDSSIWRNNVSSSDAHWSLRNNERRAVGTPAPVAATAVPTATPTNPPTTNAAPPANDMYGKPVWQPQRLRRIDAVLPPAIRRDNFDQGRALASVSVPAPQQPSAWSSQQQPDLSYQLGTANVRSNPLAPPAALAPPLPSRGGTNPYLPTSTISHPLPTAIPLPQQSARVSPSSYSPARPVTAINPISPPQPPPQPRFGQIDSRRGAGTSAAGRLPSVSSLLQ